MSKGTVRLHRVLRAKPERVYKAFTDPDAMAKWLPPYGFTCKVHQFDPKVGGTYKMSFTNFTTGHSHSFGGKYRELAPSEKISYTDSFDDPNLPGEMTTTVRRRSPEAATSYLTRSNFCRLRNPAGIGLSGNRFGHAVYDTSPT